MSRTEAQQTATPEKAISYQYLEDNGNLGDAHIFKSCANVIGAATASQYTEGKGTAAEVAGGVVDFFNPIADVKDGLEALDFLQRMGEQHRKFEFTTPVPEN